MHAQVQVYEQAQVQLQVQVQVQVQVLATENPVVQSIELQGRICGGSPFARGAGCRWRAQVQVGEGQVHAGLYIKNTHNNFHGCTSRISLSISVNFTIFTLF